MIEHYRVVNKGVLFATFTFVTTRGTKIHNCRVVQPQGKDWFATGPQESRDVNGEKKWFPVVTFSREDQAVVHEQLQQYWAQSQQAQQA